MGVHLLGIRHHGPGSAGNLLNALEEIRPDIILIEGPPEGEPLLQYAAHEGMKPPVALLAYVPENPQKAVFYPFVSYSPEWNAIKFAQKNNIPIRLMDIPLVNKLAMDNLVEEEQKEKEDTDEKIHKNPIAYLADIAGFDDPEEWWEQIFELKKHPKEVFTAIGQAMGSLREAFPSEDPMEKIREAFMRRAIRLAQREMYNEIAVICGAWHVPALEKMPSQKEDDGLIKGLPKTKVETTWVPWTNTRMSFDSGYGAGVNSPGWYEHVWKKNDKNGVIWLTKTAKVFRKNKIDVSSAHIIESVRLSESLAAIRNLSQPGLTEHIESTQTVMCMGDEILLNLIHRNLIVGDLMGSVPEGIPKAPIQADFEKQVKSLRLKLSDVEKPLTLDLRQPDHLEKSILLHRLNILGVKWGNITQSRGKGTFKEDWIIAWDPAMMIDLLEKAVWGNSIETASNHYLTHLVNSSHHLAEVIQITHDAIPAELQEGITTSMKRMDELAASTSDTQLLMEAFIPLVQIARYGNVRKTDTALISTILESIFYRMVSNLGSSVSQMDEDRAKEMAEKIKRVHDSVLLLNNEEYQNDWLKTLINITDIPQTEPVIHGSVCKILYDARIFDEETTRIFFDRALSVNNEPVYSAHWIEGFLKDGAITLLMDDVIWNIVNTWIKSIQEDVFIQILPLLRRTFALYSASEKQKIAGQASRKKTGKHLLSANENFKMDRANQILPVLEKILGI